MRRKITVQGEEFFVKEHILKNGSSFWDMVEKGEWEPESFDVLKKFLDKEHSFIDLGAWIGPLTLFGCQLAKKCFSVEPDKVALDELCDNINLNNFENINLFKGCISDRNGEATLGNHSDEFGNSATSLLFSDHELTIKSPSLTFDAFVEKYRITDCNFIKMDIEGGEVIVLPAMKDYLLKNKPTLYLSIHSFWFRNLKKEAKEIIDVLKLYKNIYQDRKLSLEEVHNLMLSRAGFSIIATEEEK